MTSLGHSSDLAHGSQVSDSSPLSIDNVTLPHLLLFIDFGAIPQTHNLLLKSLPFIECFLDSLFSGQLAFIRHHATIDCASSTRDPATGPAGIAPFFGEQDMTFFFICLGAMCRSMQDLDRNVCNDARTMNW